jgi:hypothetical protein
MAQGERILSQLIGSSSRSDANDIGARFSASGAAVATVVVEERVLQAGGGGGGGRWRDGAAEQ